MILSVFVVANRTLNSQSVQYVLFICTEKYLIKTHECLLPPALKFREFNLKKEQFHSISTNTWINTQILGPPTRFLPLLMPQKLDRYEEEDNLDDKQSEN